MRFWVFGFGLLVLELKYLKAQNRNLSGDRIEICNTAVANGNR
jgi:hypothetical protein